MRGRTTMRDVARAAGVPVSAVPLVLANKPGVSPERRARILAAVERLGYARPATAGRRLRRRRLGLVIEARDVPVFSDFYYGDILAGIQAEARRLGLSVWLHTFDPRVERFEDVARAARAEVDGLIGVSGGDLTDERIQLLVETGLPVVLVDNDVVGQPIHAVVADNFGAGHVATQHLLGLGHRRIGLLPAPRRYRKFSHRLDGYQDALEAAGVTPDPAWIAPLPAEVTGRAEVQVRALLALPPERRPTALVAVHDRLASEALLALHRHGVRVPGDLSLVGIGDAAEAASTVPPLTTVAIPRSEMGVLGVQRLVELLSGTATPPRKTVLYTRLVERESAAPPPAARAAFT